MTVPTDNPPVTEWPAVPLWRRMALPGACLLIGMAIGSTVLLGRHQTADAAAAMPSRPTSIEVALEDRLLALEARHQAQAAAATRSDIQRAPQADRFFAAALHLQAAIASPRPWLREYELVVALAPPGALARPLGEVLASHAARGIPTEADLRERFMTLTPVLAARVPAGGGLLERAGSTVRGGFANVGLVSPPAPSPTDATLAGIANQLRRGSLAAAVADAATLDASVQPLIAGWLAQARARLAVEQAIQETLLHALSPVARPA
ncbi:mitofilin family membrane protein [Humitalea sp. 24SJ18S-53]|uniref:mitofilin family membrane protein n=1 Tax=Humitalea sp. 24SJ18S-53 TaxID=3422307 RepID=UPI003D67D153